MRRRHRRPVDPRVAARRICREDAAPGCRDLDGRAPVREVGEGVVLVEAEAARRRREGAGKAVVVRHRRHGQYLCRPSGAVARCVGIVVSGGDRDRNPRVGHPVCRRVDRRGCSTAEAQVRHFDGGRTRCHPVHSGDDLRRRSGSVVAEDSDGPQSRAGCDSDDSDSVVERTDRARDVRAMAVSVTPAGAAGGEERGAVRASHDVQIGVVGLNAGVDHSDINVDPLVVRSVDANGRVVGREDSLYPGRHRLRRDGVHLIRLDGCDRWISCDRRRSGCGEPHGEAAEGMRVHEADGSTMCPRQPCSGALHIAPGLEHDDVRARVCGLRGRRPGRADRRDQRRNNQSRARSRHGYPRSLRANIPLFVTTHHEAAATGVRPTARS